MRELKGHGELLLEGFTKIHQGRLILEHEPNEKEEGQGLVWEGNILLAKNEQLNIVQPAFNDFGKLFSIALSILAAVDFDMNNKQQ